MEPTSRHVILMRILVSLFLLAAGIIILTAPNFILTHQADDSRQKAAIGWIGAVIGYWLA